MEEALSALVGVFLGAWVAHLSSRNRDRTQLVFDLHALFNSAEFSQIRPRAAKILADKYDTLSSIPQTGREDFGDVWAVIRFYQRLWVAIKYRQIRIDLVPELFGEVFFWWYIVYYEDRFVHLPSQSAQQIKELKNWFDATTPVGLRKIWIDDAGTAKQLLAQGHVEPVVVD
jgi:hypothetical protein